MNVLIVTRQYFPHGDATSTVVHNLAKELSNRGCSVQVLALTSHVEDAKVHNWEGVSVENIYLPCSIDRDQVKREWKEHFLRATYATGQKIFADCLGKIDKKHRQLTINSLFLEAYKKTIIQLQKTETYDLCITTLMPVEAVAAAMEVCSKKMVFAVYQLDTYWNNDWLSLRYQEERKRFEEHLINNADFVIATPLIKHANDMAFPNHKGRIIAAEFPMIKKCEKQPDGQYYFSDDLIHCVFSGRLYKGVRPPELVVKTILKLKKKDVRFDFYGTGQHLISSVLENEKNSEVIQLHGPVSSIESKKRQYAAQFLVNIDNTTTMQVPSKVFEYMCTGKPIINFFFNEDSPTLQYFRKYPNCENIYLNGDLNREAEKLDGFIQTAKNKQVLFSEVKERFAENTPDYVTDLFYNGYLSAKKQQRIKKEV